MHVLTVAFNQLKGCTRKFGEQPQKGKSKLWEIKVMFEVDEMSIGYNKIINKAILRVHVINNSNLLKWKGYT